MNKISKDKKNYKEIASLVSWDCRGHQHALQKVPHALQRDTQSRKRIIVTEKVNRDTKKATEKLKH